MNQTASSSNAPPRPTTPQRTGSAAHEVLLTPEQVKQIEINRLRAKAKQRLREEEQASTSSINANKKRPISNNVISTSPTVPGKPKPLARDSRLGKYFDYDLSKMVNSKGGFLVEDDKEVDEAMRTKEMTRERQRAMHNLEPRKSRESDD
jgi:DNA-repair protein complementing XP-A cells